jgi:hypothetical protein
MLAVCSRPVVASSEKGFQPSEKCANISNALDSFSVFTLIAARWISTLGNFPSNVKLHDTAHMPLLSHATAFYKGKAIPVPNYLTQYAMKIYGGVEV